MTRLCQIAVVDFVENEVASSGEILNATTHSGIDHHGSHPITDTRPSSPHTIHVTTNTEDYTKHTIHFVG